MVIRILTLCLFLITSGVSADHNELWLERVNAKFDYTWLALNKTIRAHNYKSAYLQRCDFALNERQYKSDKYRVLFFGKYNEIKSLSKSYPEIVPFLPLKFTVMEEGKHTLLIATQPITLLPLVDNNKDRLTILRWQEDVKNIMRQVRDQYSK